jgi:molybdopterin synthase catalytic subunit
MSQISIIDASFDPGAALRAFSESSGDIGAIVSFVGYCRAQTRGQAVTALELQSYPGFTERVIATYADALHARANIEHLLVTHRTGMVAPGEAIVLVAARARHRAEAFAAVEQMMDWLKTDAPFWKREHTSDGARWIEPSAQDYAKRTQCP